jgi:type I phosphodiesterase/nucleotide pyrophosphatase
MEQDDPRVDELRQQLRALGYLDAGVDRFVLGSARTGRSPWSIAALSSLRVGVLSGLLLGPTVAIGMGGRLPGLITSPRDALVVALYLALMFGLAATILAFPAGVLLTNFGGRAMASRARYASRSAGTYMALACLAYLTLWWRSTNVEAWSSPVWTIVALAVAVVVSLLLGHAAAITTFAVLAARYPAETAATPPAASTTRLVVVAGILAFVGAAALLFATTPGESPRADPPPLTVVSPGIRLVVVAIDGFDPNVFDSLRASGALPALARLAARGTARIAGGDTHDPARAWTTIATGQPPEVHGVRSLETRRVAGVAGTVASGEAGRLVQTIRATSDLLRLTRPSISSGAELRAKAFWEVAADAGLRAVIINWWATWPAAGVGPNAPVILSDRATLRLEHGGALDAEIAPKELYEPLRLEWPATKDEAARLVREFLPAATDTAVDQVIRRSAELDALQIALTARVAKRTAVKPDVLAIYLPGLDIGQHTLLAEGRSASASALSARLEAIRSYYVYLDRLVGDLLAPENDVAVLLVTHAGRLATTSAGLMALGGRVAAPSIGAELRPVDVAPTILYTLGVPISRELAGRPGMQMFAPEFSLRFPVREVATYGERKSTGAVREGEPLDQEMVERLRSLGYVR